MKKIKYFLKAILTMGKSSQSFIGAKWLTIMLRICPTRQKRKLAIQILALSPHYFFKTNNSEGSTLSYNQYLKSEYRRNKISREMIYKLILKPYLKSSDCALDYGCGPGFLAKIVSENISKVYAVDISSGVLECAKIINNSDNIEYLLVNNSQLAKIPDNSLDVIFSFAVIQHVTDEGIQQIMRICSKKLKLRGRIIFQVQLEDPSWRSEEEVRANSSLAGRVKYRYGLHCFSREPEYFYKTLPKFDFQILSLEPIQNICIQKFDDICSQHLLVAEKLTK